MQFDKITKWKLRCWEVEHWKGVIPNVSFPWSVFFFTHQKSFSDTLKVASTRPVYETLRATIFLFFFSQSPTEQFVPLSVSSCLRGRVNDIINFKSVHRALRRWNITNVRDWSLLHTIFVYLELHGQELFEFIRAYIKVSCWQIFTVNLLN